MAERAARDFTAGRNVSDELDAIGVGRFACVELLMSSFDSVNDGNKREVAVQCGAGIGMDGADGGAYLVVSVALNVFHQEIDETRIALKDLEQLKRTVGDP